MRKRAEFRSRHSVFYGASHVGWTAIGLRDNVSKIFVPGFPHPLAFSSEFNC